MKRLEIPCSACQTEIIKHTKTTPTVAYFCPHRKILSVVNAQGGEIQYWTCFPEMSYHAATHIIRNYAASLEIIAGSNGQTVN